MLGRFAKRVEEVKKEARRVGVADLWRNGGCVGLRSGGRNSRSGLSVINRAAMEDVCMCMWS